MQITLICVPYQVDITCWGCAQGPQAFLDHGLRQLLEANGPLESSRFIPYTAEETAI